MTLQAEKGKRPLTPKQDTFARCIFKGMTQADAYREAYDSENMTNEAIWTEGSKLMDHPNVAQRVQELQDLAANPMILSITGRKEKLSEIARSAIYPRDAISAIDVLNKTENVYVKRMELTVDIGPEIASMIESARTMALEGQGKQLKTIEGHYREIVDGDSEKALDTSSGSVETTV